DWVANKKACINIKNEDDLCFKYSVQCGFYELFKKDHPCEMYHYKKYVNDSFIKWDNVNFPVGNDEIEQFEEDNKHISVNVYYINPDTNSKTILLYKRSNNPQAQHKIDLIKLTDDVKSHYAYIKNYDKLMSSQTNKMKAKKYYCRTCSHGFKTEELLKKHEEQGWLARAAHCRPKELRLPLTGRSSCSAKPRQTRAVRPRINWLSRGKPLLHLVGSLGSRQWARGRRSPPGPAGRCT
ncbi:MAG: hypothetical protein NXI12_15375, partial [Alphaproteobacteria bacterium]|nr:hypothetical protein [Alphaproteobacteria bacterium]